jgi:membrane associated rhomboid family serine protease
MPKQQTGFFGVSDLPFRLVFLMWVTYTVQFYTTWNLHLLGVKARTLTGLIGIITAPLIHSNVIHIFSNTFPLLFLATVLFFFFERIGRPVFLLCYFLPNMFVWFVSPRDTYHIGASGMVYALGTFLIIFGLLKREVWTVIVSVTISIIYGSVFFYGLLPADTQVSWEGHLGGALTGLGVAIYYKWFSR